MQLTQLEIKGFKSFGDKITINFNEGVTAIVGPNGCGKSNVVDAIRWVLGEQSTRMLRSEKMENIIFNGTKNRRPSNLAEVSLSFNNTKNILPTDFTKVTITRKLYRSGESEYRLNDVTCRLKDITDLFLDTGIGSDSYSIIELKMIDEIIANKDNSRRALFEEASGISKYKLRKKQTFNKLRDAEADLSRVEDLLFEIEKNLKTLENQAKKAERYFKLKEQYKSLSLMLASFRIISFRESLSILEDKEQEHAIEFSRISIAINQLEALLQEQKLNNLNLEKNLSVQQRASHDFIAKIRNYENDKKVKNEQIRFLEEKKARLSGELEKDKNQLNHVFYNQKRLNEEQLQESELLDTLQTSLASQQIEINELREKQLKSKTELDSLAKENSDIQNDVYKLEKELAILNIQKEALFQEVNRNMEDANSKETELNEFNKIIEQIGRNLNSKQTEFNKSKELEDELKQQIQRDTEKLKELKETLIKESRKLDSKQNEYNLTKSMVDNLEGFPESIRFLKKNAIWAKQAPLFSDILFCREEYRIAIENYLEPIMNHYVVETQSEAIQAIQLLNDSSRGRANFFILDGLNKKTKTKNTNLRSEVLIPAMDIIDTDSKYLPLCEILLNNVYLLESGDEQEIKTALPDGSFVILSKSGMFSKNRIGMSGGSVGLFEGKRIGRAKNLEKLSKEINKTEAILTKLKAQIEFEEKKLKSLNAVSQTDLLSLLQIEINKLSNEFTSVKTKQEQYSAFIENSLNRKHDIDQKIISISSELLTKEPLLTEFRIKKSRKEVQLLQYQSKYNEFGEVLTSKSGLFNQENIRFHQQQNKVSGIEKDLEYRESQKKSLESKIESNNLELERTQENIKESLQYADHSDEDLIAMYAQKEEFEIALRESEQEFYASRVKITESEESISILRKNKEQSDLINNELKDQKTVIKLELNALKERLSVEFSLDINELLDEEIHPSKESENEEDLRIRSERLKKQLDEYGAINPMALEAYQEMNERYTFIQSQKKDLSEAKLSLLQTIKEIDETAKDKFMEAFINVRSHFIEVFRSLFNHEDSCDLILVDPTNPLESDIDIIARPKGKRPLSINQLSGGEKTLTATAILFSLYLLKPAPFCIFDEVDAPLDDSNIDKFNNIIREFSDRSQFIIVSHNKRTIASTDIIYGVTMAEQGVSRVVAVDMRDLA